MKNVAMQVYYINKKGDIEQKVEIAVSKRAVTKKYESLGYEVLKQVDKTDEYKFTISEVLAGTLTDKQKQMLTFVLQESGIPFETE